jgi:hypothetical protein
MNAINLVRADPASAPGSCFRRLHRERLPGDPRRSEKRKGRCHFSSCGLAATLAPDRPSGHSTGDPRSPTGSYSPRLPHCALRHSPSRPSSRPEQLSVAPDWRHTVFASNLGRVRCRTTRIPPYPPALHRHPGPTGERSERVVSRDLCASLASTPYRLHHSMAHFRILNAYRE